MKPFEEYSALTERLKDLVDEGGIPEADLATICRTILGDDQVNLYPSARPAMCSHSAILFADIKVNRLKLSFDEAIDQLVDHICGRCPNVRRVVVLCFGEFSLKKFKRFQATIEAARRDRGITIEFFQWIPHRLVRLPH